jgi:hypothetical protein
MEAINIFSPRLISCLFIIAAAEGLFIVLMSTADQLTYLEMHKGENKARSLSSLQFAANALAASNALIADLLAKTMQIINCDRTTRKKDIFSTRQAAVVNTPPKSTEFEIFSTPKGISRVSDIMKL